jgi:hypothetical protein
MVCKGEEKMRYPQTNEEEMISYVLTSTREGKDYNHILHHENGTCSRKVKWVVGRHVKGKNTTMIDDAARFHESQLAKIVNMEEAISILKLKK